MADVGFQDRLDLGVGRVGEGDDRVREAAEVRVVGDRLQPGGLLDRVGVVDLGLEVDRLHELLVAGILEEVGEPVALADRREVACGMAGLGLEPGVAVGLEVPEVMVGVDDLHRRAYSKTCCEVRFFSIKPQS